MILEENISFSPGYNLINKRKLKVLFHGYNQMNIYIFIHTYYIYIYRKLSS